MSSSLIFGSNSVFGKIDRFTSFGMDVKLDKMLGLTTKPLEAQYQSIGELSQQTAKESEPRAIIWGRVRPIGGNLIHCQAPVLIWVSSFSEGASTGKGGGKKKQTQETRTQHAYRTYAIGVCEGPITAFARIWRNNKLVYDGRGTAWGAANNGVFLKAFRLYLGGWDQTPSPDLQAIWGMDNVPAYRGTAYMVALNEDLTDQGGAIPQWLFEVERAEGYVLTSKPYAAEEVTAVGITGPGLRPAPSALVREGVDVQGATVTGGTLRSLVVNHTYIEGIDTGSTLTGANLRTLLHGYTVPPEGVDAAGGTITSGSLQTKLINYQRYPVEGVEVGGGVLVGGSLT